MYIEQNYIAVRSMKMGDDSDKIRQEILDILNKNGVNLVGDAHYILVDDLETFVYNHVQNEYQRGYDKGQFDHGFSNRFYR